MADIILTPDLLVQAAARIDPNTMTVAAMPPRTGHTPTDILGSFLFPGDRHFSLIVSDEILTAVATVLGDPAHLDWSFDERERFVSVVADIADASDGGLVEPVKAITMPAGIAPGTAMALRCAASPDLGHPRVAVVVADDHNLNDGPWKPDAPLWPAGETVTVMRPRKYRHAVERARLRLRPSD